MNFLGSQSRVRFGVFAWLVLLYNLPVILWGAFVRISFSGDGCGANWPTCNGQFIPEKMPVPMAIEYTHRMMTSLDTVFVIAMLAWAFLAFPKKHAVRRVIAGVPADRSAVGRRTRSLPLRRE
jgi:heme A synthase